MMRRDLGYRQRVGCAAAARLAYSAHLSLCKRGKQA